jgi:hypothetical protein
MEKLTVSLCPARTACPEVVIEGDQIRIGEAETRSSSRRPSGTS